MYYKLDKILKVSLMELKSKFVNNSVSAYNCN